MKNVLFASLFLNLIFVVSCEDKEKSNDGFNGTYEYTAYYAKSLVVCASGRINIEMSPDSSFTGSWDIKGANNYNQNDIGMQIGQGELWGSIKNGEIYIDLNPDYVDNNVNLLGNGNIAKISGIWLYSTLKGIQSSGSFELIKN